MAMTWVSSVTLCWVACLQAGAAVPLEGDDGEEKRRELW